ncbi:MAG TPA: TRAP transporter substrate-binding protein [Acetobacteraceae bacterium]|nr:TRAP transporter substrate-binding protein [Acetobacteraceae bacterium]
MPRIEVSRRSLIAAGAALPLVGILSRRGYAAEFTLKYATGQDPTHPLNVRGQEAIDRIRTATNGRVDMKLFPANQLGSDTDLLPQVRSGWVDFFNLSTSILATLVPACGIPNIGFAFKDYDAVWQSMDGKLGDYIRGEITKSGIIPVAKMQDNGFRQITTSTHPITKPDDLKGFKIRVPHAPILASLFALLGARPTLINFNEVYSALQTKIVEGQENPLAIIATTRLYEVQKFCSMTSHVWDGYWILGNRRAWANLPPDIQKIVTAEFDQSCLEERADVAKLSDTLRQDLSGKGLQFNDVDRDSFRNALRQTSFYKHWRAKFDDKAWSLLEATSGALT